MPLWPKYGFAEAVGSEQSALTRLCGVRLTAFWSRPPQESTKGREPPLFPQDPHDLSSTSIIMFAAAQILFLLSLALFVSAQNFNNNTRHSLAGSIIAGIIVGTRVLNALLAVTF